MSRGPSSHCRQRPHPGSWFESGQDTKVSGPSLCMSLILHLWRHSKSWMVISLPQNTHGIQREDTDKADRASEKPIASCGCKRREGLIASKLACWCFQRIQILADFREALFGVSQSRERLNLTKPTFISGGTCSYLSPPQATTGWFHPDESLFFLLCDLVVFNATQNALFVSSCLRSPKL